MSKTETLKLKKWVKTTGCTLGSSVFMVEIRCGVVPVAMATLPDTRDVRDLVDQLKAAHNAEVDRVNAEIERLSTHVHEWTGPYVRLEGEPTRRSCVKEGCLAFQIAEWKDAK